MAQTRPASRAKSNNKPNSRKKKAAPARRPVRRGLWSVICLFLGLFTLLGYFMKDYWLIDALCLYVFKGLFGRGFWIVPPVFFAASFILFTHRGRPVTTRLVCVFLLPLFLGGILQLVGGKEYGIDALTVRSLYLGGLNMETGGVISGFLALLLKQAVSAYGAIPVFAFGFVACAMMAVRVSPVQAIRDAWNTRPAYEPEPERERPARERRTTLPPSEIFDHSAEPSRHGAPKQRQSRRPIDIPMDEMPDEDRMIAAHPAVLDRELFDDVPPMPTRVPPKKEKKEAVLFQPEKPKAEKEISVPMAPVEPEPMPYVAAMPEEFDEGEPYEGDDNIDTMEILEPAVFVRSGKPRMSPDEMAAQTVEVAKAIESAETPPTYVFPPLQLLRSGDGTQIDGREEITLNRDRLETALHSFGIGASVCGTTRGPTVTRYDLELEAGVKLNKLVNLAGDLALALGVASVRIAPIPDKISTVGVEVPNKLVSTVYLHDIIASPAFQNAQSRLAFSVGKDIGGNCIVGNIAKMPHMLIAGTTGSGKSVCMNSLILSLLYKSTPDEVRLIMIDPKMVELGIYNGIPHLYIPVVTDPKKAAGSLQWSVVEMMKRYRLFSEVGVRDLAGYNNYRRKNGEETLPNVVIVIDELADLMMTAAKDVEESICRVAQMGRAAGMHLIIATQRPSADVITGLMKANIPSRISFAVSSALESRIILDQTGAEKLVGMGDMLYAPLGCGKPMRVQGAFVSDEEREDVINFIKAGTSANYDDEIMHQIERAAAEKDSKGSDHRDSGEDAEELDVDNPFAHCDELLPQAVDVIFDTKQASVSMLQRRLKLGYARAARLVDQMEELGIVGPFEGSKPRQLLITKQQWQEMTLAGRTPMERLMDEQKDDYSEEEFE